MQQDAGSHRQAAEHRHYHATDSAMVAQTTSVLSAAPAYDCDTESADVLTTTNTTKSPVPIRASTESVTAVVAPQMSAHAAARFDVAPPGASTASAFLNPLRI